MLFKDYGIGSIKYKYKYMCVHIQNLSCLMSAMRQDNNLLTTNTGRNILKTNTEVKITENNFFSLTDI